VTDKVGGHGKAGEEAYHGRPGVAYGSAGACGVGQNLLIRCHMWATGVSRPLDVRGTYQDRSTVIETPGNA